MRHSLSDAKLAILSDHYKDSQSAIEQNVKNRDRSFFFILVLFGVMAFQFFSPEQSSSVLAQLVDKQLGVNANLSLNYLGSVVWFGLFAVIIRYYQIVINLEKQYNYIHDIEEELAKEYDGKAFTREGKSYLKNYPKFSEWLHIVYRIVFPILLLVSVSIKIVAEWTAKSPPLLPTLLDSAIYVMLIISTVLFMYSLNKLEKDSYPEVSGS
jgi:hypothetical protein